MKNQNLLFYLFFAFIFVGMFSCQDQAESEPTTQTTTTTPPKLNFGEIDSTEAKTRVNKYNAVYGSSTQELTGGKNQSVLLPRFFLVDSTFYQTLILPQEEVEDSITLYASMGVRHASENGVEKAISNLVFHFEQPTPSGSINSPLDNFFYSNNSCPFYCDSLGALENQQFSNADTARTRIMRYNNIYGGGAGYERYFKSSTTQDSVLIPRYFAFNINDIADLPLLLKNDFYVSMGAQQMQGERGPIPNTYEADLIFHTKRPGAGGGLLDIAGDLFLDVTRPCPKECGTILEIE